MTGVLRAIAPGPFITIQDSGRRGWRRFGVPGSGAMDIEALGIANLLVGNDAQSAALEFAHAGGEWEVQAEACRIAVTGGTFPLLVDGERLASYVTHTLRRGQRLRIGGATDAVWGYLAVAGGFDLPMQLGSRSTHLRSGIGGWHGRALGAGDELPLQTDEVPGTPERRYEVPASDRGPLRVVLGPQDDFFAPEAIDLFLFSDYLVTNQGDRMGYRLAGPPLTHARGFNIISDGLVPGCIQVLGNGQPIVLLMDCQTIGGYPKVGTMITPDLGRLAQCRPGTAVSFQAIDVDEARLLHRSFHDRLDTLGDSLVELPRPSRRPFWLRR